MWKNMVEPEATGDNIGLIRRRKDAFACRITKARMQRDIHNI
jgi:hypothetical protein